MASSYSTVNNYDNIPLFDNNYQLITQALGAKQGALNANRQQLQLLNDQLGSVDIARGVDQEYYTERLSKARDLVNQYAHLDLSSSYLTQDLIKNFSDIVDDNVLTSVASTRIFRNEQAEWQDARKNKPAEYNQGNYNYAMRNASAWLNGDQVGQTYNGGGGFKPYVDVAQELTKILPDISKALEAEWVTTEGGQGMFRDKVTRKEISRDKVQAAIQARLGAKEVEQLKINAWNQFSPMDESAVGNMYDSYRTSKLSDLDSKLSSAQHLYSTATNQTDKANYASAVDKLKKQRDVYANKSYESLGKEGAYTTMYMDQFIEPFLDTYSYESRIVDREVDDNSYKTAQMNLDIQEFQYKMQSDARRLAFEQEKWATNRNNINAAGSGLANPVAVQGEVIEGARELPDNFSEIDQAQVQAMNGLKRIRGLENMSPSEAQEVANQLRGKTHLSQIEVTVGGRRVTIDGNANRDQLLMFKNNVEDLNPAVKQLHEKLGGFYGDLTNKLIKAYKADPGEFDAVPFMTKKIVEKPDGTFKIVPVTGDVNYYKGLLWKAANVGEEYTTTVNGKSVKKIVQPLNNGEKETLNMMVQIHAISDPNLSPTQRRESFKNLKNNLQQKVGTADIQKNFPDYYNQVATGKNKDTRLISLNTGTSNSGVSFNTQDKYLSDMDNVWDAYIPGNGWDRVGTYFNRGLENIFTQQEGLAATYTEQLSKNAFSFGKGTKGYKEIQQMVGLPGTNELPIFAERILDAEGMPTGQLKVYTKDNVYGGTGKKAGTEKAPSVNQVMSVQDFSRATGMNFGDFARTPYDSKYGTNTPSIDLGTPGSGNRATYELGDLRNSTSSAINEVGNVAQQIITGLTNQGQTQKAEKIRQVYNQYVNDGLVVAYEYVPEFGKYMGGIKNPETKQFIPVVEGKSSYSVSEAASLVNNQSAEQANVISMYFNNIIQQ